MATRDAAPPDLAGTDRISPHPLVLDLLEWLAARPRSYGEVMEAWRTSCPRLSIWEDALDANLIARGRPGSGIVEVTPSGRRRLRAAGR